MIELFRNPVTIIFGLLAVFFMLMGLGRHLVRKRNLREDGPKEKPYKVSDPYAEPENLTPDSSGATEHGERLSTNGTTAPKRYFKEFGGGAAAKSGADKSVSGYVWE